MWTEATGRTENGETSTVHPIPKVVSFKKLHFPCKVIVGLENLRKEKLDILKYRNLEYSSEREFTCDRKSRELQKINLLLTIIH